MAQGPAIPVKDHGQLTGLADNDHPYAWQSWTPTLTGITLGNGTINHARYVQIGKLVIARFTIIFGSTSVMGSGVITLPVTASALYDFTINHIGGCYFQDDDNGANNGPGYVRLESSTSIRPVVMTAGATFVGQDGLSTTKPFTWNTGDLMSWTATYEAA